MTTRSVNLRARKSRNVKWSLLTIACILALAAGAAQAICPDSEPDADDDEVCDVCDNCTFVANGDKELSNQLDSDSDGLGNVCDPDFNNDGSVTSTDFSVLAAAISGSSTDLLYDLNGDGLVTIADQDVFLTFFGTSPGPGSNGQCPTCIAPPTGMVAWWPLDETLGNTAVEVVEQLVGTYVGTSPIAGKVAGAVHIGASTEFVSVIDDPALNFGTGSFSVDAWVRTDDALTPVRVILDKRQADPVIGYQLSISFGRLVFQLADASGYTNYASPVIGVLTDGAWHHVAVTVDRAGGDTGGELYIDGVPVLSFDPTLRPNSITNTGDVRIGQANDDVSGINFNGDIDEVELFSRALYPGEIMSLFLSDSLGKCKGITWLEMGSMPFGSPVPSGSIFNLACAGSVTLTHSLPTNWIQQRIQNANYVNGYVGSRPDFAWSNFEVFSTIGGSVDLGPEAGTITYTFPPQPAGSLFVGTIGLGKTTSFGGGASTTTVNQNGTCLGDFDGGDGAAPSFCFAAAGTFAVQNSVNGAGGLNPNWNSQLQVVRIEDDLVSSVTVHQSVLRGDGIGVNIGCVPEPGQTLSLVFGTSLLVAIGRRRARGTSPYQS